MTRTFFATLLAASIAMTSFSAAPVRADSDDVAKVVVGLAALFIISKAIKKRERRHHVSTLPQLPGRCLRTYYTPDGTQQYFSAFCLQKRAPEISLPQTCKARIWTDRGLRNVYGPACLNGHGYRITEQ